MRQLVVALTSPNVSWVAAAVIKALITLTDVPENVDAVKSADGISILRGVHTSKLLDSRLSQRLLSNLGGGFTGFEVWGLQGFE